MAWTAQVHHKVAVRVAGCLCVLIVVVVRLLHLHMSITSDK